MASPARLRVVLLAVLAVLAALLVAPVQAAQAAPSQTPSETPSQTPTEAPTETPTEVPSQNPTEAPTETPTETPTEVPSQNPTETPSETATATPGPVKATSRTPAKATAQTASRATSKERVYGAINCPKMSGCPKIKVQWFDASWNYLGGHRANGGGYSLRLAPGRYHLQFTDQRPAYDTSKYAPTDVTVRVGQHTVSKNVTMKAGASITGIASAGGKRLRSARLVAANRSEQSFATTANKKGQFAIGGLPAGKYCVFTYDKAKRAVDKCTWVGGLDFGQSKNRKIKLRKKAGNLTVFVETKAGGNAPNSTATVTSKKTGQWWTSKVRSGKAVFRGLYPGAYTIKYDGAGVWFTATGKVHGGSVRPGRMAFGDFTVPKRGGTLRGHLLDGGADRMTPLKPPFANAGAKIQLFNTNGNLLATAISNDVGKFKLSGQLNTQDGLTIVVDPPGDNGGYMNGEGYCYFDSAQYAGYSVRAGEDSYIGQLAIPRSDEQDNPDCASPEDRGGRVS